MSYSIVETTYKKLLSWFWFLLRESRVYFGTASILRFLNLKRFPRTRAQVGWRLEEAAVQTASSQSTPYASRHPPLAFIVVTSVHECACVCSESTVVLRHDADVFITPGEPRSSCTSLDSSNAIFCCSDIVFSEQKVLRVGHYLPFKHSCHNHIHLSEQNNSKNWWNNEPIWKVLSSSVLKNKWAR